MFFCWLQDKYWIICKDKLYKRRGQNSFPWIKNQCFRNQFGIVIKKFVKFTYTNSTEFSPRKIIFHLNLLYQLTNTINRIADSLIITRLNHGFTDNLQSLSVIIINIRLIVEIYRIDIPQSKLLERDYNIFKDISILVIKCINHTTFINKIN